MSSGGHVSKESWELLGHEGYFIEGCTYRGNEVDTAGQFARRSRAVLRNPVKLHIKGLLFPICGQETFHALRLPEVLGNTVDQVDGSDIKDFSLNGRAVSRASKD